MTEQVRKDVWVALLDAARQTRYYGKQFERHSARQSIVDAVLVASGSLGLILVAAKMHPAIPIACVVIGSIVSLYARIGKHAQKAASVYWIRSACEDLEGQWEVLWTQVQGELIDEGEALATNQELQRQMRAVTSKASLVGLSVDEKLNSDAWLEAIRVKEQQYA